MASTLSISTTSVAGTVASSVLTGLSTSNSNVSAANTTLAGLVQNLLASSSPDVQTAIARQIAVTPYAGAAAQIAEHLLGDLQLTDPVLRSLAVQRDVLYLQQAIQTQTHQTGIISSFLSSLGL